MPDIDRRMSGRAGNRAYIGGRSVRPGSRGEKESSLDKNPRRVPEDRRATPDEVRAALEGLTDADLVRLEKYARYRVRGLGRKAKGREQDDLLGEAVQDTLDPVKRSWNKDVTFVRHLIGAMRSISSHWREQFDPDEARLESEVARITEEGETLSPLDLPSSTEPAADRVMAARRQLEDIEKAVADDRVVYDILGGMRAEMAPTEIREALGLTPTEYETAMKRFRRRVRSAQGGSNG
jgi:hypothetical protein